MSYDRVISTAGFQPLTTASSTENIGMGHLVSDLALAIGAESLGATLQGELGAFGGKPLVGKITGGHLFTGRFSAEGTHRSGIEILRRQAAGDYARLYGGEFEKAYDDFFKGSKGKDLHSKIKRMMVTAEELDTTSGIPSHSDKVRKNVKKLNTTLGKIGFGRSLRFLSRAWIVNDLFAIGIGGMSSLVQGLSSFSYERQGSAFNSAAINTQDLGTGFAETRSGFTQRQRAMQAIHNSQMNTRAAMGNEATFMHV